MDARELRLDAREERIDGLVNGEKVIIDAGVSFDVSPDIYVFYAHLALRDEIRAVVQGSPTGYAVFDAGTHIGYIYWPPPSSYYSFDFGVSDRNIDRGLITYSFNANPLDYFTDELQESILEAYQPYYDSLVEEGTTPYSDIEDSRGSINHQDTIWGVWFKDDLGNAWDYRGTYWWAVNLAKKEDLHQETYWKTLEEFPTMSGLFGEGAGKEVVGKALYEGQPIGRSSYFFILSGNGIAGVARIGEGGGDSPRTVYLKYQVQPNTDSRFDEKLIMESFPTQEVAEASSFSDNAVTFRREPCKNPGCS